MNRRVCLTCKNWVRNTDLMIGACRATDLPAVYSWRGQLEECTEDQYQFGADRPVAKSGNLGSEPLVNGQGKLFIKRVREFYAAPFGGLER